MHFDCQALPSYPPFICFRLGAEALGLRVVSGPSSGGSLSGFNTAAYG